MRAALDATPLTVSTGGAGRYVAELSRALGAAFPEDEFTLVSDQRFEMPANCPPNLRRGGAPRNRAERFWWSWGLDRELARSSASLFHGTDYSAPYLARVPSVISVHDLSPWMDARWHHAADRVRRRAPLLMQLRIATMVLTLTEAVRRAVIAHFQLHPDRVAAVPLAASDFFKPVSTPPAAPYFLYVGTLEPRKNISCLLAAWREVRARSHVDLVLAGRRRLDFPEIEAAPGLHIRGELPDSDLPALYSGAAAFLYPSWYEGFGLPVLEAMQCGAFTIASRDPALMEVSGGAAVHLDAGDTRQWVEAMEAALSLPQWGAGMREAALRRSRAFSWRQTAIRTREVYEHAIRVAAHS